MNRLFWLVDAIIRSNASKQLVEWQELLSYKLIGVRSSSGNRLLIEQHLSDKPQKLNWFYEVRHLSTSPANPSRIS